MENGEISFIFSIYLYMCLFLPFFCYSFWLCFEKLLTEFHHKQTIFNLFNVTHFPCLSTLIRGFTDGIWFHIFFSILFAAIAVVAFHSCGAIFVGTKKWLVCKQFFFSFVSSFLLIFSLLLLLLD